MFLIAIFFDFSPKIAIVLVLASTESNILLHIWNQFFCSAGEPFSVLHRLTWSSSQVKKFSSTTYSSRFSIFQNLVLRSFSGLAVLLFGRNENMDKTASIWILLQRHIKCFRYFWNYRLILKRYSLFLNLFSFVLFQFVRKMDAVWVADFAAPRCSSVLHFGLTRSVLVLNCLPFFPDPFKTRSGC